MEELGLALTRHRELEKELEEACEAEDFEKAEMVSESLAAAEKEKDGLVSALRDAEVACDAVDSEMEKVLEMQIAAEEEEAVMLEQFAKDAANQADLILKDAEEIATKEMEEWQSSMELLEIKRLETDIESQLIFEARAGLNDSIEHMVEDERKEQENLTRKKDILAKELDELLELVRLKQAEISENDCKIEQVEKRISDVFSEFHETRSNIDLKHENLQSALSKIDSEGETLRTRKKDMDEVFSLAQQKGLKLRELASLSLDEARTCQDMVGLRKTLASSILESREDKSSLGKIEQKILEDILVLREQTSAARTSLQELSSSRASIQQEVASVKQRLDYINKRGPELEAEKKVAAAARNFKEAGRIAAEAKALSIEREGLQNKKEKAVSDLEKLEEEINTTLEKIQESERLISSKEKEAATAGCRRLRLAAAGSRAERSAALELGDNEEGDILLNEAEAAESKARELQEAYDLEWEELGKAFEHVVSISMVTNLAGQHLVEIASSFNRPSDSDSQM